MTTTPRFKVQHSKTTGTYRVWDDQEHREADRTHSRDEADRIARKLNEMCPFWKNEGPARSFR